MATDGTEHIEKRGISSTKSNIQQVDSKESFPETTTRTIGDDDSSGSTSQGDTAETTSKLIRYLRLARKVVVDQWFLFGLGLVVLIASQVQVPSEDQEIKQEVVTYLTVSIVFFVTGCTLSTRSLIDNYSRWKLHLYVQVLCFLMTSATVFGIVSACATNRNFMDPWLLIGLLVVGSVPTTISSNVVLTREAGGNQALTVVESTIGNFLGPFLSPLLLSMYTSTGAWYTAILPTDTGGYGEIYKRVFKQLGLSIFLPMAVGQVVQNIFPRATRKVFVEWKLSRLGSMALLVLIWQTFDTAFETGAFTSVKSNNIIFLVFISVGIWLLWVSVLLSTSLPWLPRVDTVAVAYIVPGKGPAFAVPLTSVLYIGLTRIQQAKIQIPVVIFQGFQIAAGSIMTNVFRHWIAKHEPKREGSEGDGV